jgi:diguanylate cyclase (GGDEF)-like protein
MGAEQHHRHGASAGDADRSDGDLALATALLQMPHGPALERVTAFVSCAAAYAERELWELEAEMYAQATALLPLCEEPQAFVVLHNRPFTHLYASCALQQVDEIEEAREQCRLGIAAVEAALAAGLPDDYAASVRGVRYLLTAIAGEPRPEPLAAILADTLPLLHQHSVGSVYLAEALRALAEGNAAAATAHVEVAEPLLAFDPWSTELALALFVAAQAAAATDPDRAAAALRYGRHNARLRRQSRLRLLGSARARLETERLRMERDAYARLAHFDQLTEIGNRHRYVGWLQRRRGPLAAGRVAALVVDVDQFKDVNDVHGHATGDEVLRRVAGVIAASSRPVDLVARLGGDEFVLLLDDADVEVGNRRALALVDEVRSVPWDEVSPGLRVTVSIGLAAGPVASTEDLVRQADEALYRAKAAGRDRVVCEWVGVTASA